MLDGVRARLASIFRASYPIGLATVAWVIFSLPLVTWMAAAAALLHVIRMHDAAEGGRALENYWQGWRRHWRRSVPLGAASLVVLAALLANLFFLTGQPGAPAFLMMAGNVLLLVLWSMAAISLLPVLVLLPDLRTGQLLRVGVLLAFRYPLSTIGLLLGCAVLVTALAEVWAPLAAIAAPAAGYFSLRLTRRHLEAVA